MHLFQRDSHFKIIDVTAPGSRSWKLFETNHTVLRYTESSWDICFLFSGSHTAFAYSMDGFTSVRYAVDLTSFGHVCYAWGSRWYDWLWLWCYWCDLPSSGRCYWKCKAFICIEWHMPSFFSQVGVGLPEAETGRRWCWLHDAVFRQSSANIRA